MGDLLTCPIDGTPLVMTSDDGVFETGCHQCRREFRFTRGVLTSLKHEAAAAPGRHGVLLRVHADHETIKIRGTVFTATWKDISRQERVTVTEQFDRDRGTRIVHIKGPNTPEFRPSESGDRALVRGLGVLVQGGLVVAFATILLTHFYHWAFFMVLPIGAIVVVAAAGLRWSQTSTKQPIDPSRLAHLEREQWLLTQLQRYQLQSNDADARMKVKARQIAEMDGLARDMASAQGDYENRLQVVRRGIEALRHQRENDQRLKSAIGKAIEMVRIEYRAARALDYLPDDAIDRLSTTIAELEAIEAENLNLEAQLEANAEVHAIAPG